jgi:L-asparaginase II
MQPAVVAYRGTVVENSHVVHIAVTDSTGSIVRSFNEPSRLTLVRSAAKAAQAVIAVEAGIMEKFGFTSEELALMCASHSSEPAQVEAVLAMLAKLGLTEDALICGGHPALGDAVNKNWAATGYIPTAACNTCSGKHVGVLATAIALGYSPVGYEKPEHPVQQHARKALAEVLGIEPGDITWATDGCGLPTPAFALDKLANVYRRIAAGETPAMKLVGEAMSSHPEQVGGVGRFCTELMQAFDGQVIGKFGADGTYAVGVRQAGNQPSVGISLKAEDGNVRVLYAAVCEVLEQLGVGTSQQRERLAKWHNLVVTNTLGNQVGEYKFSFAL